MPRQDVPYGGAICRLKERIAEIWDKLGEKLHTINGVPGDGDGNVKIVSGSSAVVINNDPTQNEIAVSLDTSQLPAASVSSVNGQTGAVALDAGDIPTVGGDVQSDIQDLANDISGNTAAINAEALARQNADSALQTNINAALASIPDMSVTPDPYKGVERDAQGRAFAADPASGATDKSLTTANWISQSGNSSPNNLVHKNGKETINDPKKFIYPLDASGIFRAIAASGASVDPNVYYLILKVKAENGVIMNLSLTSDRYNYTSAHFKADMTLRLSATAGKLFVNSVRASSTTVANGWKCVTAAKDGYIYLFTNNPNIQYSLTCVSIITYGSYAGEDAQPNTTNIEFGNQNITYSYPTTPEYNNIFDSTNSVVII